MTARLETRLEAAPALSPAERETMFALFEKYYRAVTRERFLEDLARKQLVIRIFAGDLLAGFSTIELIPTEFEGRRILTIFSGDTVIDQPFWGTKALQRAFFFFLMRMKLGRPFTRVYWFLISKGHKTYLLMRNNFSSWPNRHEAMPSRVKGLLDHVARTKFADCYDKGQGVVRFPECLGAVRGDYLDIPLAEQMNPDVQFFVEKNPGYASGDELCCLAEIRMSELLRAGVKYFLKKRRRPEPTLTGSAAP